MLVTDRGQMLRTEVSQIRETGRNAQGVRLMNVDDGERVVAIEAFADTDPDGGNNTPPEDGESGANGASVNGAIEAAAAEGDAPPGGDPSAAN
jgi:DNA gyrase subunit A